MKVLLVDVNYKGSSTGKIAHDLYAYLNAHGHEAAVCYGRGSNTDDKNVYKFGLDWETYLHALLTRITGLTGCYSYFSTKRLINYIEKFKPDVIHLHEPHAYFLNISTFFEYIRKKNIPLVYTFHCEFAYTGKCGYAYDCNKWMSECKECPRVQDYPQSLFFDFTQRMFNEKKRLLSDLDKLTIVTPSQWLANRVKQSFLKDKQIQVIYNGIDTSVFYPRNTETLRAKHNLKNEKIVLAVAPGLMSRRKGGKWVLELAKRMMNQPVRFIMVGVDGEVKDLPDNVIVVSPIRDQNLLAEYYSLADCFVICSEKETFSLTCAEALCCGVPVVGFKNGASETIFNPPYAQFVEYGNIDLLQKNVEQNLFCDWNKQEIADKAQNLYSSGKMCEEYLKMYGEVMI